MSDAQDTDSRFSCPFPLLLGPFPPFDGEDLPGEAGGDAHTFEVAGPERAEMADAAPPAQRGENAVRGPVSEARCQNQREQGERDVLFVGSGGA